jgi:homospermidine synthase
LHLTFFFHRISPPHGAAQDGADELGVLLYGHARNAYWFGTRLTIAQATALAPHQNATGLQAR